MDNYTTEQWKPVVGYEGLYEVSDHGRVRSVDRWVAQTGRKDRWFPGVLLKQMDDRKRYKWVNLNRGGAPKVGKVHRMVAEAFIGAPPEGNVLCHNDGNVQNNAVGNLRWGTPRENSHDMIRMGNSQRGEKAVNSVLTSALVLELRAVYASGGHSYKSIASKYGLNRGTVASAIKRESWAWLD